MKLLHTADWHLDSSMGTKLNAQKSKERRGELRLGFARMMSYADAEGVRAVLISGDLFDEVELPGRATAEYILGIIAQYAGIDVYYLGGNHEGTSWLDDMSIPSNFHVAYGGQWTYHVLGNVTVAMCDVMQNPDFAESLNLSDEMYNIVMLHGQIGAEINLKALKSKNIDYLALGHIHSYEVGALDQRGIWAYSGCPAGRGFDETGKKGYVLLRAENKRISEEFVASGARPVSVVKVPLDGLRTILDIQNAVNDSVSQLPDTTILRVVLCGHSAPETQKDVRGLTQLLSARFYYAEVKDESTLNIDIAKYQNDVSLKGAFIRKVMAQSWDEERKKRAILAGLQALSGEEIEL